MATTACVGAGEASTPASAAEVSAGRAEGASLGAASLGTALGTALASSVGAPGGVSGGASAALHATSPAPASARPPNTSAARDRRTANFGEVLVVLVRPDRSTPQKGQEMSVERT